jgi:phosphohistidine phosphatase SixA
VATPVFGWAACRLAPAALALALAPATAPPAAAEALWALLKGGSQVVLIRHATAPGGGDPPNFRIDDCATQRNLSEEGREEARRIGAAFRARGIPVEQVRSSRWCRCLETARLAFGRAEPWPALESLFHDPDREAERTREVRAVASEPPRGGNLILVTHNFNIRALTGISPGSGEMVIVTPLGRGQFRVAGRIPPAR